MKRQIISAACGLWLFAAQTAFGQSAVSPVVVELYTSQGCSACPPADALLAQLADQPGVIALALHVDYWDYIGWKDDFAHAAFTARQKAYAKATGDRMIYTPQMIVGGVDRVQGHESASVAEAIGRRLAEPSPVVLRVTREGGQMTIHAEAEPPLTGAAIVQLVGYVPRAEVEITHGENAGLAVDYRNIVTAWQRLGEWSGQGPLTMTIPAADGPAVVIVQSTGPSRILAAAVLP